MTVTAARPRLTVMSTPELPAVSAAQDELNVETTLARYAPYVARIGFGILGVREDVDDLVQDVFLALIVGRSRLRDPAAIKPWLARTAVRIARRKLRWRRCRIVLGLAASDVYDRAVTEADAPHRIELVRLQQALDRLPVALRIAWCLRHVEQEPLERVAELCGCSLATAKRRIRDANERLRREV